jgi:hypothetical protein
MILLAGFAALATALPALEKDAAIARSPQDDEGTITCDDCFNRYYRCVEVRISDYHVQENNVTQTIISSPLSSACQLAKKSASSVSSNRTKW